MDMVFRVLKSIAVPLGLGFVICDVFVTIAWIGFVIVPEFFFSLTQKSFGPKAGFCDASCYMLFIPACSTNISCYLPGFALH